MKVLIVDDDILMRELLTHMLEGEPWEIIDCGSGEEAVKIIPEQKPGLILCDLMMPGMSGNELIEHVTKNFPLIPIIAVSGTKDVQTAMDAYKRGTWDYVFKPIFDPDVLISTCKRQIEIARFRRENVILREQMGKILSFQSEILDSGMEMENELFAALPCAVCTVKLENDHKLLVIRKNNMVDQLLEAFSFQIRLDESLYLSDILDCSGMNKNSSVFDSNLDDMVGVCGFIERNEIHKFKWETRAGPMNVVVLPLQKRASGVNGAVIIIDPS